MKDTWKSKTLWMNVAIALLYLNSQSELLGRFRNSWLTRVLLLAVLAFFVIAGCLEIRNKVFSAA